MKGLVFTECLAMTADSIARVDSVPDRPCMQASFIPAAGNNP